MKNVILIILLVSTQCVTSFSQTLKNSNNFEFGLLVGTYSTEDRITLVEQSPNSIMGDFTEINFDNQVGFSIGLLGHKIINKHLTIGFQPTFSFHSYELIADLGERGSLSSLSEALILEGPIHLGVHLNKNAEFNPSLIFGGRFSYDLTGGGGLGIDNEVVIAQKPHNISADIGAGLEIKMKGFSMKPELIYSYGLGNLHDTDVTGFEKNEISEKMRRNTLSLRLLFYN